jgi:hypothetical protein
MNAIKTLVMVAAGSALTAMGSQITLTINENGAESGAWPGGTVLSQQTYDQFPANGTGGAGSIGATDLTTLSYLLPLAASSYHTVNGWVVIYDPNGTTVSDLIHFDNVASTNPSNGTIGFGTGFTAAPYYEQVFVYSSDKDGDLADVFPSGAELTAIVNGALGTATENAGEIATYTPGTSSNAGWLLNDPGVTISYVINSDRAPDGADTICLLGLALVGLAGIRRRFLAC